MGSPHVIVDNWAPSIKHCHYVLSPYIEAQRKAPGGDPNYWNNFDWLKAECDPRKNAQQFIQTDTASQLSLILALKIKGHSMKSWFKSNWSYALNAILAFVVISMLWPEEKRLADLSKYTQNDLSKAVHIQPGTSTEEILKIMGEPALKEIRGETEEFHYCTTGHLVDEYISIKTSQGKLVQMSYYVVNWLDVAFHHTPTPNENLLEIGGMGDCKLTIRWGTYGENTPNQTIPSTNKVSAD